ncbi:MAG: glycosyltransferase family 9 protein [Acidobacteriia bacterium]|nr:glycosyltransferase family 9 protein [Terriglobia bacterium]
MNLLVVRLGSMGDIIHALPAVAALRRVFPGAAIGWAVERRWAALLSSAAAISGPLSPEKPLVDMIHAVDTLAWRTALLSGETWRAARDAVRELRALRYDIAIDFQGAWKSAILAQLSRAPRRLGFMQPREKPATLFYTHQVAARGRHVVEQNISLAEQSWVPHIGPPLADVGGSELRLGEAEVFPIPRDPAAERAVDRQLRSHGLSSLAIVNPGAGWGAKCWPAERYAEVVRALAVHGLRTIVNFGPGEESLARDVERAANTVPSAVAPPLSRPGEPAPKRGEGPRQGGIVPPAIALPATVAELIALCRHARLCIGGDTGPVHLAAALGVPVVALFGPTNPARTGPYSPRAIVLRSPLSRTTTSHEKEPEAGLLQITAAEVIGAARYLLAQTAEVRPR